MPKERKERTPVNFRLSLVNDQTHDKIWSVRVSKIGFIVSAVTAVLVVFAAFFCLIAFTPLKTLMPGYPDAQSRHDAIRNAIRIDSLESVVGRWELYSENLRRVIDGEEPLQIDSLVKMRAEKETADAAELARKDSILRENVAAEDRFDINPGTMRTLPIEGMHFFTPLSGVISQGYDKALHPYIDITAPTNSVVKAVLDGTVIQAGWNDMDGYTMRIQHEGDIISVYKHNQKLMKKTGDKVSAGTPIAIVGSSGSLSEGEHLHFELWHKGEAVDPTKYISF